MKRENIYRFSLQFSADTTGKIRAGEFLEKLGNKKSSVVVAAINEYLERHPEAQSADLPIRIEEADAMRRERLETLIRGIVQEQISKAGPGSLLQPECPKSDKMEDDIAQMLDNLDTFL